MLKNPAKYDKDTSPAKLKNISRQAFSCLATRYLCWYLPQSFVDESGMIGTYVGTHNRSENGRNALDALYDITP
jgi:hypothetical protein